MSPSTEELVAPKVLIEQGKAAMSSQDPTASKEPAELTMFAYPWDLYLDGVENSLKLVRDLGCQRVAVAVAYHSAELVSPRRGRSVHQTVEANVAHLALPARFSGIAIRSGQLVAEAPGLAERLRAAADNEGLRLTAWAVVCHNSELACRYPGSALENCFGDRSTHGLCPSHPSVRQYILELCTGILETGIFDELFVESVAYLLAGHGHPHELWAVRDDPATRYFRSLCFCPACLELGAARGVDGEALRSFVSGELRRTWNAPTSSIREPDPGDELAGFLVSRPDLASWTAMRCETVAGLVAEIAELAHRHGARLCAGLGVFARPAPLNWMEGVDPARLARVADRLLAMPYYPSVGAVARDLDHYLTSVEPAQLQVAQTLWPAHHAGLDVLLEKVSLARSLGISAFGLYNLTTATEPTLEWARAVGTSLSHDRD